MVDENVSDIRLDAAKKLLTLRLTNSFDGKIDVQFISTVIKPKLAPIPFWQEFTGYLRENLSILLTFFFALAFLFILASLFNRARDRIPPVTQVWPHAPPLSQEQMPSFGGPPPFPGGGQQPPIDVTPRPLGLP